MRSNRSGQVAIPIDGIDWHDGLLLEPLHFQQMSQRHEELVAYHVRSGFQYAWGVRRLGLDASQLANNVVQITELEAVLPDGLLVCQLDDHGTPLQLPIGNNVVDRLRAPEARCTVYLAVPVQRADDGNGRLRSVQRNGADLGREEPNVRLVVDETDLARGADTFLPLLRLKFDKQQLQLDAFLPPLLGIDLALPNGGPSLRDAAQTRYDCLVATERQLASRTAACLDSLSRLELRSQLHCVSAGMPQLGATLKLEAVTPLQLYMALTQVLGHLAVLRDLSHQAAEVPSYQHYDLRLTFNSLFKLLDAYLDTDTIKRRYDERMFAPSTRGFSKMLDTAELQGWPVRSRIAAGVDAPGPVLLVGVRGLLPEQARQWMDNIHIASEQFIDDIRERRVRGAARYCIDAEGGLLPLTIDPDPQAKGAAPELQVDVSGLRDSNTVLFAIATDPHVVRGGERLLLEVLGGPVPEEVMLLVAAEHKP